MNGNKFWEFFIFLLAAVLCLGAGTAPLTSTLEITLELEGAATERSIPVWASWADGGSTQTQLKLGRNSLPVRIPGEITVIPDNENALHESSKSDFLVGTVKLSQNRPAGILHLTPRRVQFRTIVLRDQNSEPVANINLSREISVTMGEGVDLSTWKSSILVSTNNAGSLRMPVVEGCGDYSIIATGMDERGRRFKGKWTFTWQELIGQQGERVLPLNMEEPSIKVTVVWDADGKPFKTDGGSIFERSIGIAGKPETAMLINDRGVVYIYGLKPGDYRLEFLGHGNELYEFTRASDTVNVSDLVKGTVEQKVTVRPRVVRTVRVSVVDADTGSPVDGVKVSGPSGQSVAPNAHGVFVVEGDPLVANSIGITHPSYEPLVVKIPTDPTAEIVARLVKLPQLSGQVVDEQGKPQAGVEIMLIHDRTEIHGRTLLDGTFSVVAPKGRYRIEMRKLISSDPGVVTPAGVRVPRALVLEEDIQLEKAASKKFTIGTVGRLHLRVAVVAGVSPQRAVAVLLAQKDGKIVAVEPVRDNGEAQLYARPGEYDVFVMAGERTGRLAGVATIAEGKPQDSSFTVDKWNDLDTRDGAHVKEIAPKN